MAYSHDACKRYVEYLAGINLETHFEYRLQLDADNQSSKNNERSWDGKKSKNDKKIVVVTPLRPLHLRLHITASNGSYLFFSGNL